MVASALHSSPRMDDLGHPLEAPEALRKRFIEEVGEGLHKGKVGEVFLLRPLPRLLIALPPYDLLLSPGLYSLLIDNRLSDLIAQHGYFYYYRAAGCVLKGGVARQF